MKGGFVSQNLLDDALTIAIIESGVPIRAFDADRVEAPLGIRPSVAGEELEGRPNELPARDARDRRRAAAGRADLRRDRQRPRGDAGHEPDAARSVGVKGVPEIAVEEALWLVSDALLSPPER